MDKIIISDKLSEEGINILKDAGFTVDCKYKLSPQELGEIIGQYSAIIIRSETQLSREIIEKADNLKVIGRAGVGLDNVDIETATKKGIVVMNAPGGNTISTCEQTFALMLAAARNIASAYISVKGKKWERSMFKGIELHSKVLGVIGFGRIGKEVSKRALSFGMEVLVYDPFISVDIAQRTGVKLVDLQQLLKLSDFVTIHTPLTEETENLISRKELAMMKPKAVIINCARGGIIDEDALYEALKEKKIAQAALDVFSKEPPTDSKLLDLDNVVATPHLGASTEEAQINVAIEIAHCVKDMLLGKAIRNAANYVQIEPETYKVIGPYFDLCEKMGKFIFQLIEGRVKDIKISFLGEISTYKIDVLTAAFVKGFLSDMLEERNINYINSLEIAKERGIKIEQIKIIEEEEYVNSVRAKVITDKKEMVLQGTLFAGRQVRFVRVDDVYVEAAPSQDMLVITNQDKPGVIGFLGTVLGSHKINIADMSLGRSAQTGTALTILNLDSPLDAKVKAEIQTNANIISLKSVRL